MSVLTDEEIDRQIAESPQDDTPLVKQLREALADANKRLKRMGELEEKLASRDLDDVIAQAELDLNDDQKDVLKSKLGDSFTPEKAREVAVRLGWAEAEPEVPPDEQAALDRIAGATNGAEPPATTGTIKPDDVREWTTEKMLGFREQHPQAWESLKKGEAVTGIVY